VSAQCCMYKDGAFRRNILAHKRRRQLSFMIHEDDILKRLAHSAWFRLAIIFAVTIAGAIWLIHKGPTPVIRGSTRLPIPVPFWYMILAFPILGMLIADLVALLFTFGLRFEPIELCIQIIILIIFSSVRLSSAIPISGHSQLLGYFFLRRILINYRVSRLHNTEILIASLIFAAVIIMKLWQWSDYQTLIIGLVIGGAQATISYLLWRGIYGSNKTRMRHDGAV
jgi:hypothetical protein